MRVLICSVVVVVAIGLATVVPSRGEGDPVVAEPSVEPVIGQPVEPLPAPMEPRHEPFTPYEYGGPPAAWSYEQLTVAERAVADRGLNEDQTAVQAGYAAASATMAALASEQRAALQLGVDEPLGEIGVVP